MSDWRTRVQHYMDGWKECHLQREGRHWAKSIFARISKEEECSVISWTEKGREPTYFRYRNPSSSLCSSYMELIKAACNMESDKARAAVGSKRKEDNQLTSCGWQDVVDVYKDRLFRAKLDSSSNDINELTYRQVGGNEILLLIDHCNIAVFCFFANDWYPRWIFSPDSFWFSKSLF